jgi:hypothetical protein
MNKNWNAYEPTIGAIMIGASKQLNSCLKQS